MIESKPRWPDGTISPWAGHPNPPTVLQVALAYPGRALRTAFLAYFFGAVISGLLTFGIAWVVHTVFGHAMLASPKPMFIVWPFVSIPLWYGAMHGEIRGRWVSTNRD